MKVHSSGDGGIYLGASSQYPGSIASVDVDMFGTGNVVVATSNGRPVYFGALAYLLHVFNILYLPGNTDGDM